MRFIIIIHWLTVINTIFFFENLYLFFKFWLNYISLVLFPLRNNKELENLLLIFFLYAFSHLILVKAKILISSLQRSFVNLKLYVFFNSLFIVHWNNVQPVCYCNLAATARTVKGQSWSFLAPVKRKCPAVLPAERHSILRLGDVDRWSSPD